MAAFCRKLSLWECAFAELVLQAGHESIQKWARLGAGSRQAHPSRLLEHSTENSWVPDTETHKGGRGHWGCALHLGLVSMPTPCHGQNPWEKNLG